MSFNVGNIQNPILRTAPGDIGARDACLYAHDGTLYCYFSAVWWDGETVRSRIEMTTTRDLKTWTPRRRIADNPPVFWSPGNATASSFTPASSAWRGVTIS